MPGRIGEVFSSILGIWRKEREIEENTSFIFQKSGQKS
jgi:hypothetical protein